MSNIWQTVLAEIELQVTRATFATWFKNTTLLEHNNDTIRIGVPNIFAKQQLQDKFNPYIKKLLKQNGLSFKKIEYEISASSKAPAESPTQKESVLAPSQGQKKSQQPTRKTANSSGLNEKYLFSNFIVGSSNELAYAACQAIAKDPGKKYNPLFIYGGVGLGKTHLIQAVGNEIRKETPSARVMYISSETFIREFLDSIRLKRKHFSERYRNVDVLVVDDMQFIAGKEKTQEEFFHTFNALHQANKQIIISSDKPPKAIPTLEERLRSRFEWGMTVDIQAPDFETRCAILQTKADHLGMNLPVETIEFLATHNQSNIRKLEGALNQLIAFCELRQVEPTIDAARSIVGEISPQPKRVTPKQVVEKTARHFHVSVDEVLGPKRDKDIVLPRQVAMYLLRSELHLSFPKVARELGRKDHTTAIHSVEKIQKGITLDPKLRQSVHQVKERLYV